MKNYLIIVVLIVSSCSDILQENPKSVVEETFYNNAGELETAVNAIFPPIRAYNGFGFLYPAQLESYSDIIQGRGSYSVLNEMQGLDNTNITRIGSIWDQFYLGIRNANIVIRNAGSAELDDSTINHYVAEARFMRAFIYFHLVQNFGNIVLRTVENMEELHVPLSSSELVYDQIIEDLEFAEQYLPDTPSVSGRPTVWAAKAVLANVYLVLGDNSGAMEKSGDIITSNKFSLVEVVSESDFQNLYGPTIDNTQEEIFYLKYNRESGWSYVEFLHHPSSPYYNGGGLFAQYIDTTNQASFWNQWSNDDLRKQLFYSWDFGLGPSTVLSTKFIDMERIGGGGNDYPFYRYADVLLIFAEASAKTNNFVTQEGLDALNMVQRRAYGHDPTQTSEIDYQQSDFSSLEEFIDVIFLERAYETYVEGGKRWLDLKRLDKNKVKEIFSNYGIEIDDRHFFWPIPETEIELNNAIDQSDQNPGY